MDDDSDLGVDLLEEDTLNNSNSSEYPCLESEAEIVTAFL